MQKLSIISQPHSDNISELEIKPQTHKLKRQLHLRASEPKKVSVFIDEDNPYNNPSPIMKIVLWIRQLRQEKWYINTYLALTIILVSAFTIQNSDTQNIISIISQKIQIFCQFGFLIFTILRLLSFQQIHYGWCMAQFISFTSGISSIFVANEQIRMYLHALACFRALIIVRTTKLYGPFCNFVNAFRNIIIVAIPILITIFLYALVGLFAFSANLPNNCSLLLSDSRNQWQYNWQSTLKCQENQCPVVSAASVQPFCLAISIIEQDQYTRSNKGYNLLLYKNIFYSFYNTYKILFMSGWSKVASINRTETNLIFLSLYFVSFLYMISFIYMDIFSGMMMVNQQENESIQSSSAYSKKFILNERDDIEGIVVGIQEETDEDQAERKRQNQKERNKTQRANNEDQLNNIQAEKSRSHLRIKSKLLTPKLSTIVQDDIKKLRKSLLRNPELKENLLMIVVKPEQPIVMMQTVNKSREKQKSNNEMNIFLFQNQESVFNDLCSKKRLSVLQKDYYLPTNPNYKTIILKLLVIYKKISLLFIFLCCLNLLIDTSTSQGDQVKNYIDCICIGEIFLTFLIQLSCYQAKQVKLIKWCQENNTRVPDRLVDFNQELKFQMYMVMLTGGGIINEIFFDQTYPFYDIPVTKLSRVFRCFKFFRICKIFFYDHYFETTKIVMSSIGKTIRKMLPYIGFYMLMLLIFSLISFNLFHHKGQQNLEYSFREVYTSMVLIFMIFCNNQEESIIYEQYQVHGELVLAFHVLCLTIGSVILSKYFMALFLTQLLDELDARDFIGVQRLQDGHIAQDPTVIPVRNQLNSVENNNAMEIFRYGGQDETNLDKILHKVQIRQAQQAEKPSHTSQFVAKLRTKLQNFIVSKLYLCIHITITFICIGEAFFRPPLLDRTTTLFTSLGKLQLVTFICIFFEAVIEIFAYGFIGCPGSYLKRMKSNIIALVIAVLAILNMMPFLWEYELLYKLSKLKILRMYVSLEVYSLRDFRMKLSLIGFIRLTPKLFRFLVFVIIFYSFISIFMVAGLKGQYYYCTNQAPNSTIVTMVDCLNWGGDWINHPLNSDNSLITMINLILTSFTESWSQIITPIAYIRGKGLQPSATPNTYIFILCMVGYLAGSFIILNVFIGYSLYQMKHIARQETGQNDLNQFEVNWLCIKEQINLLKLVENVQFKERSFRYYCNVMVSSIYYKILKIVYMVIFNVILSFVTSDSDWQKIIKIYRTWAIFIIFSFIFSIVEALGRKKKQKIWLLCFQASFYAFSIVYFYLLFNNIFQTKRQAMQWSANLLTFHNANNWLYIMNFQFVNKTLKYLSIILPRSKYILIPMFIVLLTYTFTANEMFAMFRPFNHEASYQGYTSSFESLMSLIKFSTWEAPMQQIIQAAAQQAPNFVCFTITSYQDYLQYGQNGCGNKWSSYIFFLSFHIIYTLVMNSALMVNIFDSYVQAKKQEQILLREFELDKVTKQWQRFDEKGEGYISYDDFWCFASGLYKIYGATNKESLNPEAKSQFLSALNIRIYQHKGILSFQFYETIQQLVRYLLSKKHRQSPGQNKADLVYNKIYGNQQHKQPKIKTQFTSKHVLTIIVLRRMLTAWHAKIDNPSLRHTQGKSKSVMGKIERFMNSSVYEERKTKIIKNMIKIVDI